MTNKKEPTAWALTLASGCIYGLYEEQWEAAAICDALKTHNIATSEIVPLYRQPQTALTDEERKAIRFAEHEAQAFAEMGGGPHGFAFAATLRNLLERTGVKNVD